MRDINRTRLATGICCLGVVITGLALENSVFSLCIVAASCIGSLSYGALVCGSRIKAAKLFLLNAGLLVLIFALLGGTLTSLAGQIPVGEFWQWRWLHRIFRVGGLSDRSAIIVALMASG